MTMITNNLPTKQLQALDAAHHMHPFTANAELAKKGARVITRAEGVYLTDSEGHRILDGMAGLWCMNIGYGRDSMADVAARQMRELPYYNTFFQTTHVPAIALSAKLAELAPGDLNHVFFAGSGSESNDTNLLMVRRYWQALGHPEKNIVIARKNAYHGSTYAGRSLGGMSGMHEQGGIIANIEHIGQPHWYMEGGDMTPEEFGLMRARELEDKILELGVDRVAAFIGEPVQGAGGVVIPPSTYWPEIQRIVDKYGILLIADEVITGFGRTGNWFGSQTFGIKPHIMTIAKGLSSGYVPIGGSIVCDEVAKVVGENGDFNHGYTYSAHPVACAAGLAALDILEREELPQRVATLAPYFEDGLHALAGSPYVSDIRNYGFAGALQLEAYPGEPARRPFEIALRMWEKGFYVRYGGNTIQLGLPFVIEKAQIDSLLQALGETLREQA